MPRKLLLYLYGTPNIVGSLLGLIGLGLYFAGVIKSLWIFNGAKSDVDGGYVFNLSTSITGEVFGDIVTAAKGALSEGKHVVACVLACAALEDALKRHAAVNGLDVEGKTMEEVVNSLKSKGLVSGAQKILLGAMPKIRNYAMHADWEKLEPQDAGSVIGFVEHFLLEHFSFKRGGV